MKGLLENGGMGPTASAPESVPLYQTPWLGFFAHLRFQESGGLHRSPDTGPYWVGSE